MTPHTGGSFNPRSHEGSDHILSRMTLVQQGFNPRSHEGSDTGVPSYRTCSLSFNPRSHEGSDGAIRAVVSSLCCVSIHAPTKGATHGFHRPAYRRAVSIHAPTKGATALQKAAVQVPPWFQSTLPRRERLQLRIRKPVTHMFQSTLPRRERRGTESHFCSQRSFNPRSHEGSDWTAVFTWSSVFLFQSTLPRRERLRTTSCAVWLNRVSIHAPTKGATGADGQDRPVKNVSIHAPTKGATFSFCAFTCPFEFQSTLPRRERLHQQKRHKSQRCFNPRSHEGSDADVWVVRTARKTVSIHAPTKGATKQ